MRRVVALILCFFLFTTTVYAENAASQVSAVGTVSENGTCQVALTVTIRLSEAVDSLVFPLGPNVSNVKLNGGNASLTRSDGITYVKLNYLAGQEGSFTLTIHYTLKNLVTEDDQGNQTLTVPLLYGFKYPVEKLEFSITMPDTFDTVPSFYSGYFDQSIESSISYTITGATISGSVLTELKDSETLVLELDAPDGMFVRNQVGGTLTFDTGAMVVCALLALLYWLLALRHFPRLPGRRSTPPDGLSAGMVGSYLFHREADLTMMVVHWAQLGYLLIHLDENGRVMLHKKMDMGNERSAFEQRCFRMLFRKRQMIEGTGYHYARLWEQVAAMSRRSAVGLQRTSGNPTLFRILACGVALFAGIAMGDSISIVLAWRIPLIILLAGLGCAACWYIQTGMTCLHLRERSRYLPGLALSAALLAVSAFLGSLPYGLIVIVWGLLSGLLGAYGGRRSENGARIFYEIQSLRRYMKKVTRDELLRIVRSNPDYYFELAPFAIAQGLDKQFARRFGRIRQPACGWLVTGMDIERTAEEWYPLLREAVDSMNVLHTRPLWEKKQYTR